LAARSSNMDNRSETNGRQQKRAPFVVLTAEFLHETNTFSKFPTTLDDFFNNFFFDSEQEIDHQRRGTTTSVGGTFEAADRYGWELVNTVATEATPSGRVTNGTFEHIANLILSAAGTTKIDGCLIHLHGAMVTEGLQDAEGELLKRLRLAVGLDVPIIVTLDLHANVSKAMCQHANCLVACRTYPHVDFYETALRAAALLQASMSGTIKPVTVLAKRPLLRGLDGGKTDEGGPMKTLLDRAEALEADSSNGVLTVSVCAGFAAADVRDVGPSVTVTVDRYHGLDVGLHKTYLKNIRKATKGTY
jgi:microcystin degradation protein MlrC